ncbi:hypothetical protein DL240_18540 [Lujinxingia litoralis]|uniref:SAP domain-containing protein n=1 Tax=Lujinxingia litoralis TaxID=2211119 RepID=A0A328C1E4_9DELT|nr:SAP domain-containing protein [Lujinxingia litoralis]RAL20109.1 hypothetical protein DL240_18540 [Lujinxingia litoralis]
MKIEEATKFMTTQYLTRVLNSFTRDIGKLNEHESRDYIVRNAEELSKPDNVQRRLDLFDVDHHMRALIHYILEAILNSMDGRIGERELTESVQEREQRVLDEAQLSGSPQYADERSVDILRTVLQVAFDDKRISQDEYALIEKLRQTLHITRKQQRLIEASMGVFPKQDGTLHAHSDISDAVSHLQKQGVLFYCNKVDDGRSIVLPEEMHRGVKLTLGIDLSENAQNLLWSKLKNTQLKDILKAQHLPSSGSKEEMVERLMSAEIKPSEGLASLSNNDLYDICQSLPGVKVSGSKLERINRIIAYFDNLLIRDVPDDADPDVRYYEYFTELAERDRENLLANNVISKDIDIERAFEKATHFIFREKLQTEIVKLNGTEHPDGCVMMPDGGQLFWDNKSTESVYTFPNNHLRQFKRYLRDTLEPRVNCFLIIVPSVSPDAEENCLKLKFETQHNADVAVISAEDLKWLSETWKDSAKSEHFNLSIFCQTGILSRKKIEQSMRALM